MFVMWLYSDIDVYLIRNKSERHATVTDFRQVIRKLSRSI